MSDTQILFETRWIRVCQDGKWQYVRRPTSDNAVGILAITPENEVILVEQFRIPTGSRVVEIPAGLVGDEPQFLEENLEDTARRELLEETGYYAETMKFLLRSPSTPGLAREFMNIYLATDLRKESDGGGIEGENIEVYHVPLTNLRNWLNIKQSEGVQIDARILAALWLANISA